MAASDYLTYDEFIRRFPEFKTAPAELVEVKLLDAQSIVSAEIWEDTTNLGHGLYAAHLLALSPFGQAARMMIPASQGKAEPTSTYWAQFKHARATVCGGFRISG